MANRRMKKFLVAITAFCFYRVEFLEPMCNDYICVYEFKMYPRKINLIIIITILSPLIILIGGVGTLIRNYKDINKVYQWSSYNIRLLKNKKPSKWEAYKKF